MGENNVEISFQELFTSKLKERGLTLRRLSELSGVALKHLENFNAGHFDNLPPAPYLRGYLVKIGYILDFDGEAWWEKFKSEGLLRGSGASDELPKNRFARKPFAKHIYLIAIIALAVLYAGFRSSSILGQPSILITYPDTNPASVRSDEFLIQGTVENATELSVNEEPVVIEEGGRWQKSVRLEPGLNSLSVKAKKFLGRETEVIQRIVYEPPLAPNSSSSEF